MKYITLLAFCFLTLSSFSQVGIDYDISKQIFTLKNERIERRLINDTKNRSFYTSSFRLTGSSNSFFKGNTDEFDFALNDTPVIGSQTKGALAYQKYTITDNPDQSKILKVDFTANAGYVGITLCYQIYPQIAVIRKWLEITNLTKTEVKVSDIQVEKLNVKAYTGDIKIYGNYARDMHYASYTGYWNDPAVMFHIDGFPDVILGNEAPSVLKRTDISREQDIISVGTTRSTDDFPFRKWLKPGETFQTFKSFMVLYNNQNEGLVLEADFQTFINKYLGVKLFERKRPPMFVYSPYIPFECKFDDKLYMQMIDHAADCGIDYFQITWAWYEDVRGQYCAISNGDYKTDPKKFPNGLKPVIDHIKSKGMKPCLYFALSTTGMYGRMAKEHPDWIILNREGKQFNLHSEGDSTISMCMSSGWREYIKNTIIKNVEEYDIKWVMLDLSFIVSAYINDVDKTGCHAKNHGHKDAEESYQANFNNVIRLFDELKARFPDLYIDCTYELWGRQHIIDYALIEHADGDWISNLSSPLEARQICHDRARVIPTSSMLIGNLTMDAPQWQFNFWSLLPSTIVMLGDLRNLAPEQKKWYKDNITRLTRIEDKYQYSRCYQSIADFSRPSENNWDGCIRFNKEKGGGLICVYRNNSPESQRIIQIPQLNAGSDYRLFSITKNRDLGMFHGEILAKDGLLIWIDKINTAEIILIEEVDKI
jgi:alpha-galactosidase